MKNKMDIGFGLIRAPMAALLITALPFPASGQIGPAQPGSESPAALDPETSARLAAQRDLTSALSRIAANSSDWMALSQAGRAALALGDARAAIGFLARAEAQAPRDPIIKAAMGAAMVQLEDPAQAMRYFDAAIAAGGLDRTYMADRGLAFDLLGEQARARADYAIAAVSHPSAELTRRTAISLGISGEMDRAVQLLGPLLRAQDRAAWRSRAMIVAMNGRADEAREIARATMPQQLATGLEPYFAMMDRLTPAQLALAAHFGRFPSYDVVSTQPSRMAARSVLAAAAPPPVRGNNSRGPRNNRDRGTRDSGRGTRDSGRGTRDSGRTTVAMATPPPAPTPVPTPPAPEPAPASPPPPPPEPVRVSQPVVQALPAPIEPTPAPPTTPTPAPVSTPVPVTRPVAGPPNVTPPGIIIIRSVPASSLPTAPAAPAPVPAAPAPATTVVPGWSLESVVASIRIPEAERAAGNGALSIQEMEAIAAERRARQRAEAAAARTAAAAEAETRRRNEAEARQRAEEEATAREEAETLRRHPARIWVQIATGADVAALGHDCRRLARAHTASFNGQSCASAVWNRTRRLVVGPFRSAAAARTWLTAYTRDGGEGFAWSSAAGQEVTPIGR
ncbi:MAG: SPOR domain-containing protein [Sphingopyxis sp.]